MGIRGEGARGTRETTRSSPSADAGVTPRDGGLLHGVPGWPLQSEEQKAQEPRTHTHREFFFSVLLQNI